MVHTPNLDALARAGTVFENAYCNSPLCVPSRMSMFTGLLPSRIAAYDNASEFPCHVPTMMHYLRRARYRTAVSGKTHFIGAEQLHGFDDRLTPCIFPADFAMLPDWSRGPVYNKGTSVQSMLRALGPSKWNRQLAYDQMAFDRALEYLDAHQVSNKDQPLFLNISLTQPHDPFTSTQEFLDLYKDTDMPLPADHGDIRRLSPTYEWFVIHHGLDKEKLSAERIREARRNYLDDLVGGRQVGPAHAGIGAPRAARSHGGGLHERSRRDAGRARTMVEAADARMVGARAHDHVRPRQNSGRQAGGGAGIAGDLFPTFVEMAQGKMETPLDGHSLLPLVDGKDDGRERECVAEYLGEGTIEPIRMVRTGKFKYITVNGYPPQLFDLSRDPQETTNIAGSRDHAGVEASLRRRAEVEWDGGALKKWPCWRTSGSGRWCSPLARPSGISNRWCRGRTVCNPHSFSVCVSYSARTASLPWSRCAATGPLGDRPALRRNVEFLGDGLRKREMGALVFSAIMASRHLLSWSSPDAM